MNPDDETLKDIRKWYHDNGIEYLAEDWDRRDETGESAGAQRQESEISWRAKRTHKVRAIDPLLRHWWPDQQVLWAPRDPEEKAWLALLDEFFTPYLSMMTPEKTETLARLFNDRLTYEEAGEVVGITRQGAHRAVGRALQDLTLLIAKDDDWFAREKNRPRDYAVENRAARRVFMRYLAQKGWTA